MSSLHRAGLIVVGLLGASAGMAACAGSDEELPLLPSDAGVVADRAASDVVEDREIDAGTDTGALAVDACSAEGWCSIDVDSRLSFDDLWPLDGSVVAIASRSGRSSVLVYEGASWRVIHDVPFRLTSIWASKTDVWVSGGEAGYVAHGRRNGADWKWTVRSIAVPAPVSVVWGTGEHELYALADARVWRLPDEGGDWAIDFGGDAPEAETTFISLTGTSKDDVWMTGVRGTFPPCGVVAHKSAGAWVTVVEGTPEWPDDGMPTCAAAGSAVPMTATVGVASATAPRELVAITEGYFSRSFVRIRHPSDGGIDIASADVPRELDWERDRSSIWGATADDLYLAGFSKVNRGRNIWADGGGWQISTVAFEGIALVRPFHVVRGTRSDDVWLAGESYVFHKTSH